MYHSCDKTLTPMLRQSRSENEIWGVKMHNDRIFTWMYRDTNKSDWCYFHISCTRWHKYPLKEKDEDVEMVQVLHYVIC